MALLFDPQTDIKSLVIENMQTDLFLSVMAELQSQKLIRITDLKLKKLCFINSDLTIAISK